MVVEISQVAYANGKCIKPTSKTIQQIIHKSMKKQCKIHARTNGANNAEKKKRSGAQKGIKKPSKQLSNIDSKIRSEN